MRLTLIGLVVILTTVRSEDSTTEIAEIAESGTLRSLSVSDSNDAVNNEALVAEETSSSFNKTKQFLKLDLKRGIDENGAKYLNCTLKIWENDGLDKDLIFVWAKDNERLDDQEFELSTSKYGLVNDRYVSLTSVLRREGLSLPSGHFSCQVFGNGTRLEKLYRKTFKVITEYNDTCKYELDCGDDMSCVENQCVCKTDLVHITDRSLKCGQFNKCLRQALIGEDCYCDQQCVNPNSRCNYLGKCGYKSDFVPFDNSGLSCVDSRTLANLANTGINYEISKAPMIALFCLLSTIILGLGYLLCKRSRRVQIPSSQFVKLMQNVSEITDKPPSYQDVVKQDAPPSYKEPTTVTVPLTSH